MRFLKTYPTHIITQKPGFTTFFDVSDKILGLCLLLEKPSFTLHCAAVHDVITRQGCNRKHQCRQVHGFTLVEM